MIQRVGLLLAGLWVSTAASAQQGPQYGPGAEELLRAVERATLAVKSLRADLSVTRSMGPRRERASGTARLMRPNLARVDLRGKMGQTIAANGLRLWVYNASTNQYVTRTTELDGTDIAGAFGPLLPVAMFFDPRVVTRRTPEGTRVGLEAPVSRGGLRLDVIALTSPRIQIRLFVGPDRLVRRSVTEAVQGSQRALIEVELAGVKVGGPFGRAAFAYAPPKNAAEIPGSIKVNVGSSSGKQNRP